MSLIKTKSYNNIYIQFVRDMQLICNSSFSHYFITFFLIYHSSGASFGIWIPFTCRWVIIIMHIILEDLSWVETQITSIVWDNQHRLRKSIKNIHSHLKENDFFFNKIIESVFIPLKKNSLKCASFLLTVTSAHWDYRYMG